MLRRRNRLTNNRRALFIHYNESNSIKHHSNREYLLIGVSVDDGDDDDVIWLFDADDVALNSRSNRSALRRASSCFFCCSSAFRCNSKIISMISIEKTRSISPSFAHLRLRHFLKQRSEYQRFYWRETFNRGLDFNVKKCGIVVTYRAIRLSNDSIRSAFAFALRIYVR